MSERRWLFVFDTDPLHSRFADPIFVHYFYSNFLDPFFIRQHHKLSKNIQVAQIAFSRESDGGPFTWFRLVKWMGCCPFQESPEWDWFRELCPSAEFYTFFNKEGSMMIRDKKDVAKILMLFDLKDDPERYWSDHR